MFLSRYESYQYELTSAVALSYPGRKGYEYADSFPAKRNRCDKKSQYAYFIKTI